jgi:hypothetical protein
MTQLSSMSRLSSSIFAWNSSIVSKTTARPRWTISAGVAALGLMIAPRGARLPRRTAIPGLVLERRRERLDHVGVEVLRAFDVGADRQAVGGDDVEVKQVGDLLHHDRQAAGIAEVLHQVLARRLQVDEARQLAREPVEVVDAELDAEAAGDRDQVDHGVGRAADRRERDDRVLERLPRQHGRDPLVLVDHVDDAPAGHPREHVAPAVDRRIGGVAGQAEAERLDHARHRARRSHRHAVAVAAMHAALGIEEVLQLERSGAHLLAHAPDAGARAELLAAPLAVQHRPARDADRRQVDARCAHDERRRRLVAAHEQDDAVDRVAADRLLDVHRREVAVEHRRRS